MTLPATWSSMSIDAKAAYLCQTHQARNYPEACRMLSAKRRRAPAREKVAKAVQGMWWNK